MALWGFGAKCWMGSYMALWGFGAKCWMGEWAGWVTDGWIDC